jgi:hypothetical protein
MYGSNFPDGGLGDLIIKSELQHPPVLHAPIPVEAMMLLTALHSVLNVAQKSNATCHTTNPQANVMVLFGTLHQQASAANQSNTTSPPNNTHALSPLGDRENIAVIIVDDEKAEINLNEDPLVTLKQ